MVGLKPVPRAVYESGEYPDTTEHPARRLTALCLKGWHDTVVGSVFRWSDENIILSPFVDTSYDQWEKWAGKNRRAVGWPWTVELYCRSCGRRTRHAPKGHT